MTTDISFRSFCSISLVLASLVLASAGWLAGCAAPETTAVALPAPAVTVSHAPIRPPAMPTKRPELQNLLAVTATDSASEISPLAADQAAVTVPIPPSDGTVGTVIASTPATPPIPAMPPISAKPPIQPTAPAKPPKMENTPPPELALLPPDQGPQLSTPESGALLPATRPPVSIVLTLDAPAKINTKAGSITITAHLANTGKTPASLGAPTACNISSWDLSTPAGDVVAQKPNQVCAETLAHTTLNPGGTLTATETLQIDSGKLSPGKAYILHYTFWGSEAQARLEGH